MAQDLDVLDVCQCCGTVALLGVHGIPVVIADLSPNQSYVSDTASLPLTHINKGAAAYTGWPLLASHHPLSDTGSLLLPEVAQLPGPTLPCVGIGRIPFVGPLDSWGTTHWDLEGICEGVPSCGHLYLPS